MGTFHRVAAFAALVAMGLPMRTECFVRASFFAIAIATATALTCAAAAWPMDRVLMRDVYRQPKVT
jgi:branched-subunit amino acid ABC-type transport system permease component